LRNTVHRQSHTVSWPSAYHRARRTVITSGGRRAVITSRCRRVIHPRCRAVSVHLRRRLVVSSRRRRAIIGSLSSSRHHRFTFVIAQFSGMLHFQIYFSFQFQRVAICLKIVNELCDGAP